MAVSRHFAVVMTETRTIVTVRKHFLPILLYHSRQKTPLAAEVVSECYKAEARLHVIILAIVFLVLE